jgi:O-methyltransferase domain/Dimerisation domain
VNPSEQMQQLITGFRVSQAIHTAAELRLSDLLAQQPMTVGDLATAAECDPRSLHRLLRALASVGVYEELPDGRFASTPLGDQLRSDVPGTHHALATFSGRPYWWQAWSALPHSIRTGQNAFRFVHGRDSWEYKAEHPEESAVFDANMTANSVRAGAAIVRAYDFGRFATVVDVAGGRGALLAAILGQHQTMRGILFDQPHVVSGAAATFEDAGVHSRCEIVGGDMFDAVPAGGDAYVLKAILHDWEDPQANDILAACRRAMNPSATLLVMERLLDGAGPETFFSDLNMLVGPGGLERSTAEYADLFTGAGFRLTRTVSTGTPWAVIEAVPAA